jgi:hypothetical protein
VSRHIWLTKRITPALERDWHAAYDLALDLTGNTTLSMQFATYAEESVRQKGSGGGLGDEPLTHKYILLAAARTGHRYARGRNAQNYLELGKRMMRKPLIEQAPALFGLSVATPPDILADRYEEAGMDQEAALLRD